MVVLTPPQEVPASETAAALAPVLSEAHQLVSAVCEPFISFQKFPFCLCETELISVASKQRTLNQYNQNRKL